MQPYRIEEMAKAIHADSVNSQWAWHELADGVRESYLSQARRYAAVLLGGEPVVEVQHGVRNSKGKIHGPYKVAQDCMSDEEQVQREKVVYPAAAFVSAWVERDMSNEPRRPSNAVSARYTVGCPACGARGASAPGARDGEPCRAKSGRVTDTHESRINAQWPNN
jgi:hypothetical protein